MTHAISGERLKDRYMQARREVEAHSDELKDLEDTLNALDPSIVPRYHELYEMRGGEQFRPDPSKFSCKTLVFDMDSFNQKYHRSYKSKGSL